VAYPKSEFWKGCLYTRARRLRPSNGGKLYPAPDVRGFENEGSLSMLKKKVMNKEEFFGMAYRASASKKERIWGTPTANDAKNSLTDSQRGRGTLTADIVESLWPTPRTAGMCGGTGNWAQLKEKCEGIEEARQMGAGNGGRLNPDWVEALMGYPQGWTDIDREDVDTDMKYPGAWIDGSWEEGIPRVLPDVKNRINRLKCLGNAVVPQIPALLWILVLRALWT
jgi:hypothetical protein